TDDAESEEFDTLETEIKSLDSDLVRLRRLEQLNVQRGTLITDTKAGIGSNQQKAGSDMRGSPMIIVKSADQDEKFKGQNYTRFVIAKALAYLDGCSAAGVAAARWGKSNPTLA